jgi:hypothetical protein
MNRDNSTEIEQQKNVNVWANECAILSLKPKKELFTKLKELSESMLSISKNGLDPLLDDECLDLHTVPVCIPLQTSPDNLNLFIKENSALLIDLMLTAWPFPIDKWGFTDKNIELVIELIDIKYWPYVCKAISKPTNSTLDLAVTIATATKDFTDYIVELVASKQMILNDDEMERMQFILSTGIAIVTNQLERTPNQSDLDYFLAITKSSNYLLPYKGDLLQTLFYFYFRNKVFFPKEIDNKYINRWFDTKTYLRMYMYPDLSI